MPGGSSPATAIHWIESNLTPLHSLDGQVRRMSIAEVMEHDGVPGVSIAFVDEDRVSWTRAYGYADVAAGSR